MHILVVGDINSSHIQSFNKSLIEYGAQQSISITLDAIHIHSTVDEGRYSDYEQLFVPNVMLPPFIRSIPKIRVLVKRLNNRLMYRKIKRQIKGYDCILLHGFWKKSLDVVSALNVSEAHIVGAFWGSDFYRRNRRYDNQLQNVLQRCNRIIISTRKMEQEIVQEFKIDSKKIDNVLFGVQALQMLFDFHSISKAEAKKKILQGTSPFVITCGYCARPEMRHKEIIAEIKKVEKHLPQDYILVFPMTYSGNKQYIEVVRNLLRESKLQYLILDSYLSDEDVVYLRKATDVFIQIQTTDANSGSMQEHIVAQNVVITGRWLPYQEYVENNIYFATIDTPNELSQKLVQILLDWDAFIQKVRQYNLPEKFRSSLWSETIKDWFQVITKNKITING